jgi:sphinganine-1-phosphate aldolase
VQIPLTDEWRADVDAAATLVGDDTAVVVASAFSYPHGVMDPVAELAALAARHGAGCHVDACIGAFVLPFLERLGHTVPPWDFRVDGVTEISADVHKYGFVPKGASVVLHRDADWFGHQVFLYDRWPSGIYGSPAIAGARSAAPIAAAWAALRHLGIDGYTEIQAGLAATTRTIRDGVDALDGISVVGDPIGPVLAFESDSLDLSAVGDVLDDRGWNLNRNTSPPGLHMMLSPAHGALAGTLLADLADALAHHGESRGLEARYS